MSEVKVVQGWAFPWPDPNCVDPSEWDGWEVGAGPRADVQVVITLRADHESRELLIAEQARRIAELGASEEALQMKLSAIYTRASLAESSGLHMRGALRNIMEAIEPPSPKKE